MTPNGLWPIRHSAARFLPIAGKAAMNRFGGQMPLVKAGALEVIPGGPR